MTANRGYIKTFVLAVALPAAATGLLTIRFAAFEAQAAQSVQSASSTVRSKSEWLPGLEQGQAEARRQNRALLVRAGATWCGWCRKLEEELTKPATQKALSNYVLVYLDIDDSPREVESLGIEAVPALRVLTPTGRVSASQDGYLAGDKLADWLGKQHAKATAALPAILLTEEVPDEKKAQELVDHLCDREPLFREAAIQRLMPHPRPAAPAVVRLFVEGGLSDRLAAMELLNGWKAPLGGMDPWHPDTITPQRIASLQAWAKAPDRPAASTSAPAKEPDAIIETARRELARLLQTDQNAEAEVVRERLARIGPAVLPTVVEELKKAVRDRDRERLTALRYRLTAPPLLVLDWPGGLERLASTNTQDRQKAAEELAARSRAETAPLLRELFTNPDPLVREISLRALRKVGGEAANEALTGLLGDPEPNVRAAVLKQLTEQPSRKMVQKIAEYVARETDPDLLVHAVRVFRAAGGKESLVALIPMARHEAWQVRAEVAEAIAAVLNESGDLPQASRADAYVALIELLKDQDGFVVTRAMTGLNQADVSLVIEPLSQAVLDHPELAGPLMEMLANRGGDPDQVSRQLRKLLETQHADVRASAIVQLCRLAPKQCEKELMAAFVDAEEDVRFAAAKGFLLVLNAHRPEAQPYDWNSTTYQTRTSTGILTRLITGRSSGRVAARPSTSPASQPQTKPSEEVEWLDRFRSGKDRPKWMEQAVAPLQLLLSARLPDRRLTAAVGLIALGYDPIALPVLRDTVRSQATMTETAAEALAWLPIDTRLELFHELLPLANETQSMARLIAGMASVSDPRAAAPLWDLLGRKDLSPGWAESIQDGLRRVYLGRQEAWYNPKPTLQRLLIEEVRPWTERGPEIRQIVALSLLLTGSRSDAVAAATLLYENPQSSEELRKDALQIMLLGQSPDKAGQIATAALSRSDDKVRETALLYLARGPGSLHVLRGTIHLLFTHTEFAFESGMHSGGSPIVPKPPPGPKPDDLRPLLTSTDGPTRAHSAYLLALLKHRDGIDVLIDHWRQNARNDEAWRRQVYRAITALNDDKLTPVLEEIYADLGTEDWQIREFYWTIRSMEGEKILELRKKIRAEVGMERLK